MSERLFAALYYISHGVSKLAPTQNIVSVTDLLVLLHPNKRIGYVSPTTVKYCSKLIPLALKKNKDISFTRKLVLLITPTIPECVKVSIGDQNNETCR